MLEVSLNRGAFKDAEADTSAAPSRTKAAGSASTTDWPRPHPAQHADAHCRTRPSRLSDRIEKSALQSTGPFDGWSPLP